MAGESLAGTAMLFDVSVQRHLQRRHAFDESLPQMPLIQELIRPGQDERRQRRLVAGVNYVRHLAPIVFGQEFIAELFVGRHPPNSVGR